VSKKYSMTVLNPLTIKTASLKTGQVGKKYSATISIAGGAAPYTLTLETGTLPNGLTFDPQTQRINGIPTIAGTFPLTFRLVDNLGGSTLKDLSLTIQ
jgi:hypothetical protein